MNIIAICTENYKSCIEFTIKSWLRLKKLNKIYVYSDSDVNFLDYKEDKIENVNFLKKSTNYDYIVNCKPYVLKHYLTNFNNNNSFIFMDTDCYIFCEEIFDIFTNDFDIGITRLDDFRGGDPFKKGGNLCSTISCCPVYYNMKNVENILLFSNKWIEKIEYQIKNKILANYRGINYDQWSFDRLVKDDLLKTDEIKIKNFDRKIYNFEENTDEEYFEYLIKNNKSKVIHFKSNRWKNKKFIDEIIKLMNITLPKISITLSKINIDNINFEELYTYKNIYHYSFCKELIKKREKFLNKLEYRDIYFIYPDECHDQWSPLPVYTNLEPCKFTKEYDILLKKYVKGKYLIEITLSEIKNKLNILGPVGWGSFWYLPLFEYENFNKYLEYRSKISSKPKKRFPTKETFYKIADNYKLIFKNLEIQEMNKYYNIVKNKKFTNRNEKSWDRWILVGNWSKLKSAFLFDKDDNILACAAFLDSKNISLHNAMLTSKRTSNIGYGIILLAKVVEYAFNNNYKSIDSGYSGAYGLYKQKIFTKFYI